MAVVVEVGPITVCRLGEPPHPLAEAALEGIDGAVVLVDEQPRDVDEVWRNLFADLRFRDGGSDDLLIVHPSWWPRLRVERILAAAPADARCVRRCDAIAARMRHPITVIEVDRELVTVAEGEAAPSIHARHDVDAIIAAIGPGADVAFDAPAGVKGDAIRHALTDTGVTVREGDLDSLYAIDPTPERAPRRRWAVVALALPAVAAAALWLRPDHRPVTPSDTVALVEGRIAVSVPAQWTVQRITGGTGSRRLQVSAPGDTGVALHITAAYVPDSTLRAAAEVLGRAAAAQPPGVFSGLRLGVVAGRDALTYQESRPGRVIGWTVLLDGATRIAVGCQSPPGRDAEAARQACEQAIRSAHEVSGTAAAR